ncbi:hypothetical protein JAAARDRAFT_343881 [Jaapia argillacea MUCL 33604]|uniref:Uncharacterized protein n=1 Tax=Jaapia argillacea MUCL 33604 TaxID=933084 RepID=A0A067PV74_9AGAM|nr:hypothetical protein JAAARDRAFT_343881 [Jaapia argillacea MUCL 33604]
MIDPFASPQITSFDFEQLLWVYYHFINQHNQPSAVERWLSVLRLCHMYQINSVKEFAVEQLMKFDAPIVSIIIGRETGVEELVLRGYVRVASSELGLEPEEADLLGFGEAMNVMRFALQAKCLGCNLTSVGLDKPGVMDAGRHRTSKGYASSREMFHECYQYHRQKDGQSCINLASGQ